MDGIYFHIFCNNREWDGPSHEILKEGNAKLKQPVQTPEEATQGKHLSVVYEHWASLHGALRPIVQFSRDHD